MLRLKIDQVMHDKGINTRQLSELTGVRWNTIDDMAKNKAKHWSPDNLNKIMVALGIEDVTNLIEYVKDEKLPE